MSGKVSKKSSKKKSSKNADKNANKTVNKNDKTPEAIKCSNLAKGHKKLEFNRGYKAGYADGLKNQIIFSKRGKNKTINNLRLKHQNDINENKMKLKKIKKEYKELNQKTILIEAELETYKSDTGFFQMVQNKLSKTYTRLTNTIKEGYVKLCYVMLCYVMIGFI